MAEFYSESTISHPIKTYKKLGDPCSSLPSNSSALTALLQGYQFFVAELYKITLASGSIVRLTSGDGDIES